MMRIGVSGGARVALGDSVDGIDVVAVEVALVPSSPPDVARLVVARHRRGIAFVAALPSSSPETAPLVARRGRQLAALDLAALVTDDGQPADSAALNLPLLPVVRAAELADRDARARFLLRARVHRALLDLFAGDWRIGELVALHARLKLLLMAHAPAAARALGRLVGVSAASARGELATRYATGVMAALASPPSRGRHVNALEHMVGYFRDCASDVEQQLLRASLSDYRRGLVPLAVPVSLLRRQAARHEVAYLRQQLYLEAA